MYDAPAITSVLEADEVRYERREAEKRGGNGLKMGYNNERLYQREGPEEEGGEVSRGQGGQLDQGGHEGPQGPDWLSGPRGPRPSAACRVNLSAAFEAVDAVEAVEAVEAEWSAAAATALRLDS